jgi:nucleoside 2-deoxyribosyltransferase
MRRTVYLAGAISGLSFKAASASRERAAERLVQAGWDVLDPLRGKEILSTLSSIDEGEACRLLNVTPYAIVSRDRDDIRRADVVLILSADTPSYGTLFEWEFAYNCGKPIVVVASRDDVKNHPWCQLMTTYFAKDVDDAVDFIIRWLDRGYRLPEEHELAWMAGYIDGSSFLRDGRLIVTGTAVSVFEPFLRNGATVKSPTSVWFDEEGTKAFLSKIAPFRKRSQ